MIYIHLHVVTVVTPNPDIEENQNTEIVIVQHVYSYVIHKHCILLLSHLSVITGSEGFISQLWNILVR